MGEEYFPELKREKTMDGAVIKQKQRPWLMPFLLGTTLGLLFGLGSIKISTRNNIASQQIEDTSQTALAGNIAPTMTVTTAPVKSSRIIRNLNARGSIAARNLIPVLPQANSLQVKEIRVKQGDFVKQGQVMAVLDDSLLQEQIRQAKADVESEQAEVASRNADLASQQATLESAKANVAANQAIVKQRLADVAQAKAKLVDFERNFQRNEKLAREGAISTRELDTSTTDLATAREALRLAEANVQTARANVISTKASISSARAGILSAQAKEKSAEAKVRSSQARVEQLRTQLGQTIVRAPVSGIVAERLARVGDVTGTPPQTQVATTVGGTQKLFSIISDAALQLQAEVPDVQLAQVKVGSSAKVTSGGKNGVQLQGKVSSIEPLVNNKRAAIVKIDLPATTQLKPGMFARAEITTNSTLGLAVPRKAVLYQPDGNAIVFTFSDGEKVRTQKVEVGESMDDGNVEIKSGLQAGERIVVTGAGYLKDGDKVRVAQVETDRALNEQKSKVMSNE